MKAIKKLPLVLVIALFSLFFTACGAFAGFDDDAAIVKHKRWSAVLSTENNDILKDTYSFKADKCNGVKTIRSGLAVEKNPVFDITLKVESGRFKVVLVQSGGDKVYTLATSAEDAKRPAEIPEGVYNVKIVAEDAKVTEFKISY